MMEGFLPIAGPNYVLPKLHIQRCIINLKLNKSEDNINHNETTISPLSKSVFHISKSSMKTANKYRITINTAFDDVGPADIGSASASMTVIREETEAAYGLLLWL